MPVFASLTPSPFPEVGAWITTADLRCTPETAGDDAKAISVASVILHALSGYRVGTRTVTVRPVRLAGGPGSCGPESTVGRGARPSSRSWPLPGPVSSVTEVKVDGAVVTTWSLIGDTLHHTTGSWPADQDMGSALTETGTWSVTYVRGVEPDEAARQAASELACELIAGWNGQDCRLPQRVTTITRQGVTVALTDPMDLFDRGRTGIPSVDLWLATVNPHNQRRGASVAYPGAQTTRRIA